MQYVGIQSQISRNNRYSVLLLIAFPALLLLMYFIIVFFIVHHENSNQFDDEMAQYYNIDQHTTSLSHTFLAGLPFVLIGVGIWFLVAYTSHVALIRMATGAKPLERKDNMRVYNLVENLCIELGMKTPSIYIIDDDSLNAFASGIDEKTYSITLSKGIIDKLNDDELQGVIGHELTHIRNHDTRLLIISIIFVGIFAFLAQIAFRSLGFTGSSRRKDSDGGYIILIAIAVTAVCYFISIFLRFGISRRREYLADAGSAEITHKPYALASALQKIDDDPLIEAVHNEDVAQLFIENPQSKKKSFFAGLFDTHPPIQKRIELLNQFV